MIEHNDLRSHQARVLLVDDQPIISEALRRLMDGQTDITFKWEAHGTSALQTMIDWRPTVVLQDLMMPDADGVELVKEYRRHQATRNIPVIVLSTKEDPQIKANSFAAGANDYLIKLPDRLELLARLRYHSSAYLNLCQRDAAFLALRDSEKALTDANARLQRLAEIDGLTGIANRRCFDEALEKEWQRALRTQRCMGLLLCDLDFFKSYNDHHGHQAGDECLRQVARVLEASLRRPADLAARYGGEEFALILPETDAAGATAVADFCRQSVRDLALPHVTSLTAEVVTMSFGVASMVPHNQSSTATLLAAAAQALYKAKRAGRDRTHIQEPN